MILLGTLFLSRSTVQAASGTNAASFLEIPVGAGPATLGGAYTAPATDPYAPVWNPAGLARIESPQVAGEHVSYLESIHYEHISAVMRLRPGFGIGFSARYLGSGDIQAVEWDGSSLGNYSNRYGAYALAAGYALNERLSIGAAFKYIDAKLADVGASAVAADAGVHYRLNSHLSLAATLNEVGTKLQFINESASLPLAARLGGAWEVNSHWLFSAEGHFPKSDSPSGHFGSQWKPIPLIAIRAGYRTDTLKELDALAGFSTGIGLTLWGNELAYAWVPYGELGNAQYLSLIVRFGTANQDSNNVIKAPL